MEERFVRSKQLESLAAPVALRSSSLMRRVNNKLRHLSEAFAHSEPIAFFCECQNASCYAAIWMSMAAYDATLAERTGWLLLEGHEPLQPRATLSGRESVRAKSQRFAWLQVRPLAGPPNTTGSWSAEAAASTERS